MMSLTTLAAGLALSSGAAFQDGGPVEWRRSNLSDDVPGATAFTEETDGVRQATFVAATPFAGRTPSGAGFRSFVLEAEVRCAARMWRIVQVTWYAEDYSIVDQAGPIPDAPLVRETPLHAAMADVCDGGHGDVLAITTEDAVAVLQWLAES